MNRRNAIKMVTLASAGALVFRSQLTSSVTAASTEPEGPTGPHVLPPLQYPVDALIPYIDGPTMAVHHNKHHAAYVKNLNTALIGQPESLVKTSVDDLLKNLNDVPESIRTAVRNNGGGHYNHTLFWQLLSPKGGGQPKGILAETINKTFNGYDKFYESFSAAAAKVFGSGWAWLSLTPKKTLVIESTPNQDSPLSAGNYPLLGIDVWEHAYYLSYQSARADYIRNFAKIIHWDFVEARYEKALH